ncbi:MFS transporter [Microbispora sp. NPDC046933]|uniref:MFS transporter n=1 Tax=Microbispora sp. NPDC046933 TaxID=3155618 RepID=UPI0033C529CC
MRVALKDSLAPLRSPGYRSVFLANTASFLGDQIVTVALAFAVLEVTGSATALGVVLLARTVPLAVFVLTGGVWADRLPRQLIMVASDVVRLVSQAVFAALLFTGHAPLWAMVVLQAVHGTASAFYRPASSGLLAQLLPSELRQRGSALMYSMSSMAGILGPVLAGVILAVSSPAWTLAIDAASFGISGLLLLRVRTPERGAAKERNSFLRDLADGWGEVTSRSWLRSWIFNFALFQFAVLSAFMVLGPLVSETSLGGETAWAVMSACLGVGSLLGSFAAIRWHPARPLAALGGALLTAPVVLVALAFAAPVYLLAATSLLFGAAIAFADAVWEATLQNHVPERVLSRVVSYDWLGSTVLRPIGLAIVGPMAAGLGADVVLIGAAVLYVVVTGAALAMPVTWALSPQPVESGPAAGVEALPTTSQTGMEHG